MTAANDSRTGPGKASALLAIIAGALVLPVVQGLFEELRTERIPISDHAVLELYVRRAAHGDGLVGPYSRFGWHHPGPLYFYLLAPAYRLGSASTASLHVAVAVSNAVCLAVLVRSLLCWSRGAVRSLLVGLALALELQFLGSPDPGLTDIWNPFAIVMPYGVFCVVCAWLYAGNAWALPLGFGLHALLVQTHIGYGVCASAALGVGLVGFQRFARRNAANGGRRRVWLVAVAVIAACWAPPIADWFVGSGNLRAVAASFIKGHGHAPLGEVVAYTARQLQAAVLGLFGHDHDKHDLISDSLAVLLSLSEVALLWRVRKRNAALAPACLVLLVQMPLALVSNFAAGPDLLAYLTLWSSMLGMLGWSVIALGSRAPARLEANAVAAGAACALAATALAALLGLQLLTARRVYDRLREPNPEALAARSFAEVVSKRASAKNGTLLLRPNEHDDWGLLAGLVLALDKQGVHPLLPGEWRFMFGGERYADNAPDEIRVAHNPPHDLPAIAWVDAFALIAAPPAVAPRTPVPRAGLVILSPNDNRYAPVMDGKVPPDGSPWDTPGAVELGARETILLGLPVAMLEAVTVSADGNDTYRLEASTDGRRWSRLAELPQVPAFGLQTRSWDAQSVRAFRFLSVTPGSGDGAFSIAEITPRFGRWSVGVIEAHEADGDPGLAADGVSPPEGQPWDEGALRLRGTSSFITLALPDAYTTGFTLLGDGNDVYAIDGSFDGIAYQVIGTVPEANAFGLRRRAFYFNDAKLWPILRIRPVSGDGLYSVAEVEPLISPSVFVDIGTTAARPGLIEGFSSDEGDGSRSWCWMEGTHATLGVSLDPATSYDLLLNVQPSTTAGDRPRMRVDVNGDTVAVLQLHAGLGTYRMWIPRRLAWRNTRVDFSLVPGAPAPSGTANSVAFERAALVPRQ